MTPARKKNLAGYTDEEGRFRPIRDPEWVSHPTRKATRALKKKYSRAKAGDLGPKRQERALEDVFQREIRLRREADERWQREQDRIMREIEADAYGGSGTSGKGQTLAQFVRSAGGIRRTFRHGGKQFRGRASSYDAGEIDRLKGISSGLTTSRSDRGKPMDKMFQAAREAGYDVTDIDDMMDRIETEAAGGRATYATHGSLSYNPARPSELRVIEITPNSYGVFLRKFCLKKFRTKAAAEKYRDAIRARAKTNPRKRNIEMGYYAGGTFHPIRESRDYDPARAGETRGSRGGGSYRLQRAGRAVAKRKSRTHNPAFRWSENAHNHALLYQDEAVAYLSKNNSRSRWYSLEVVRGKDHSFQAGSLAAAKSKALSLVRKEFPEYRAYRRTQPTPAIVNRFINKDVIAKHGPVVRVSPSGGFGRDLYTIEFADGYSVDSKIPKLNPAKDTPYKKAVERLAEKLRKAPHTKDWSEAQIMKAAKRAATILNRAGLIKNPSIVFANATAADLRAAIIRQQKAIAGWEAKKKIFETARTSDPLANYDKGWELHIAAAGRRIREEKAILRDMIAALAKKQNPSTKSRQPQTDSPVRLAKAAISVFDTDFDLDVDEHDLRRLQAYSRKFASRPKKTRHKSNPVGLNPNILAWKVRASDYRFPDRTGNAGSYGEILVTAASQRAAISKGRSLWFKILGRAKDFDPKAIKIEVLKTHPRVTNPIEPLAALSLGLSGVVSALTIKKMVAEDAARPRRKAATSRTTNGTTPAQLRNPARKTGRAKTTASPKSYFLMPFIDGVYLSDGETLGRRFTTQKAAREYARTKKLRLTNPPATLMNTKPRKANGILGRAIARHRAGRAFKKELRLESALARTRSRKSKHIAAASNPAALKWERDKSKSGDPLYTARSSKTDKIVAFVDRAADGTWFVSIFTHKFRDKANFKTVAAAKRYVESLPHPNPQTTARRRTYEMFQGRPASMVRPLPVSRFAPARMDQLGDLIELKLSDGQLITPNPKRIKLCAAGGRLWIAGGRFATPNPQASANELNPIGRVEHVVYGTFKPHHGDNRYTQYIHRLGEDTGHLPTLAVDRDGFPVLRGGRYKIEARGIVN